MDIEAYLSARRGKFEVISDINNRFPHYVKSIRSWFEKKSINVKFIRSQKCASEIIWMNSEQYLIIDRQADLYMNALCRPEILCKNDSEKYSKYLFESLIFIVCNELFYHKRPVLSKELYQHYISEKNLNFPIDFYGEIAHLNFIAYHEWGHIVFKSNPEMKKEFSDVIRKVFYDHVDDITKRACDNNEIAKNIYYRTVYSSYFEENNLEECCADYASVIMIFNMMDENPMSLLGFGNKSEYISNCMIKIHQYQVIRHLKKVVQSALKGEKYSGKNIALLTQRLRVTRQILNRYLTDHQGIEKSQENYNTFSEYFQRFDTLLENELYDKTHNIILANKNKFNEANDFENANRFCIENFSWV